MERLKSIVLVFLVFLSLLQSFFLTYSMPNFDGEKRVAGDYVVTEPMGPEEKVENLINPEQIILHLGNDEHTLLEPNMTFYTIILNRLQGRSFEGFQRKSAQLIDWHSIRKEKEGIELKFSSAVPVKLLQKVMPIGDDATFLMESVTKMIIYAEEESNDVVVLFVTTDENQVYESTRADLTVQDVKQQVEFGRQWTPYQLINESFYIPKSPLEMVEVVVPLTSYEPDQMVKSLFFDPTLTKIIRESDGSTIYTDGKRGLRLHRDKHWITFTDATAPTEGSNDASSDMLEAVSFVNKHGGWNGNYRLMEMTKFSDVNTDNSYNRYDDTENTLTFQLYWGSYPIISTRDFQFGYVQVKLQQGEVINYERSLIQLETRAEERVVNSLPGGDELIALLKATNRYSEITHVDAVYEPILSKDNKIQLKAVWQVKFNDGSVQILR